MNARSWSAAALAAALVLAAPAGAAPARAASSDGGLLGGLTSTLGTATGSVSTLLAGSIPSWAHGTHTAVPGSDTLTFAVQLPTRNQAQLDRFVADVNDPASPSYHHYLTPQQYAATYGPTAANVSAATAALSALGMTVKNTTSHGSVLVAQGTIASLSSAFGTTFGAFEHDGASLIAPLSAPRLPSSLQGLVADVAGLSQEFVHRDATPDAWTVGDPCSSYFGEKTATDLPAYEGAAVPYVPCGYTGAQLRSAYQLDRTGLTGKGATIGIVDAWASPTALQDADQLATSEGDQPFADGQFSENIPIGIQQAPEAADLPGVGQLGDLQRQLAAAVDTNLVPLLDETPGLADLGLGDLIGSVLDLNAGDVISGLFDPAGWGMEEELDIEAVHAMAPDAGVIYQAAVTPEPALMYAAVATLVEQGKVQAITNSYGTSGDGPLPTDQVLFDAITTEAAATGITMLYSSGDEGDQSQTGTREADFPATSDLVLAVGGTSARIGADGALAGETYWGTKATKPTTAPTDWDLAHASFTSGGGGGVSTSYAEPSYQQGVVPQGLATFGGVPAGRVVPDLALDADPSTGMRVGMTMRYADGSVRFGTARIGGTSLSSPLMAGMLALAVQAAGGQGLGLVNPTLYGAASGSGGLGAVFDDPAAAPLDAATGLSELGVARTDHAVADDPASPSSLVRLVTMGNLQTLHALPGYDDSTGLGSPKAAALVHLLVPGWTAAS